MLYQRIIRLENLAKPVNLTTMKLLATPKKADDKKSLLAYADWVENSSSAKQTSFVVVDNDHYQIKGEVGEGEGILVQMTADSGWSAKDAVSDRSIKTGKDPLGFLVLYPHPPAHSGLSSSGSKTGGGAVDITLKHGKIWQEWLGYLVSFGTVGFIFFQKYIKQLF